MADRITIKITDPANAWWVGWDNVEELRVWAERESTFWQGEAQAAIEIFSRLGGTPAPPFRAEIEAYQRMASETRGNSIPASLGDIERQLNERRLLVQGSPIAQAVLRLKSTAPTSFALASTASGSNNTIVRLTDSRGQNGVNVPIHAIPVAATVRFPPRLDDIDPTGQEIKNGRAEISAGISDVKQTVAELRHWASEIDALEKTYREDLKLHAAHKYWKDRADLCNGRARNGFFGFVGFVALFLVAAVVWSGDVLSAIQQAHAEGSLASIAMVTLPALAYFWILRLTARFYVLNLNREADAQERATLVETYLALCKDTKVPPIDGERLILIRAISRPGPGDSVEEAPQDAVLDQLLAGLTKK